MDSSTDKAATISQHSKPTKVSTSMVYQKVMVSTSGKTVHITKVISNRAYEMDTVFGVSIKIPLKYTKDISAWIKNLVTECISGKTAGFIKETSKMI